MGFITVQNGEFLEDSQPFRFNGTNAYYLVQYQSPQITPNTVVPNAFDAFELAGIKVIRMWAMYDGYDFGTASNNPNEPVIQEEPGEYNEQSLSYLDEIINLGKQRGFKFILTLLNYEHQFGGILQYNTWAGLTGTDLRLYTDHENNIPSTAMHAFINNNNTQNWYKAYISELLNRVNTVTGVAYKDEEAIMAWEIINEGKNPGGNDNGEELRDWYQNIAQYIKSIDSNHLVATGEEGWDEGSQYDQKPYSNTFWMRAGYGTSYKLNCAIPEIDFCGAHWYPSVYGWAYLSSSEDDAAIYTDIEPILQAQPAYIKDHNDVAKNNNKPFIMGEYGLPFYDGDHQRMQEIKNAVYVPFYRTIEQEGVSGSCLWQFVADWVKAGEFGGNICYPGGRRDELLFEEYRKHSVAMSQTPEEDAPDVVNGAITLESVFDNRFKVSVNAADGDGSYNYKLYFSSQNNLGSTPETVEANGILADEGFGKLILEAVNLQSNTQYWYNVVVENNIGEKDLYQGNNVTTLQADTDPPVISDGTISIISTTANSFDLSFIKATDVDSADEELIYKLFVSRTASLDGSVNTIESEGELIATEVDVSQLKAVGLQHSTKYYFNIVVEDPSGNKAAYTANTTTTLKQQGINRSHPMAQSLMVYYQFDQGGGRIIDDISNSDNNHTAIIQEEGGVWNTINGEPVWSKRNGESEWMEITNHSELQFGVDSPFTIGFIGSFGENNSLWNYLFHKGHHPGYHISFAGWDDFLKISIGSVSKEINIGAGIINDAVNLHSIVLVVEAANKEANLYVDGIFVDNIDLTSQISTTSSGNPLRLPQVTPIDAEMHYNRFAIWRRALTAQEVSAWHEDKDLMLIGAPDQVSPEISDKSLSTSAVTDKTFTVNFEKAVDEASAPEELIYRLYISTSDNISTIQDAESNGVFQDVRSNTSFLQASGLNPQTQYWFNVIVEDSSGNKAAYSSNNVSTLAAVTSPTIDTNHSLATDLIAYYQFYKGSGNTIDDISNSANIHNAEAKGEGGLWSTINNELVWSKRPAKNEWLEIADHNDLHFGASSPFTIGLFCAFSEDNSVWNLLFNKGLHPGFHLAFAGWDDIIRMSIGSEHRESSIPTNVKNDLDKLHSIVMVITAANDKADLYIDGSFIDSVDLTEQVSTTDSNIPLELPIANTADASTQVHYNRFAVWRRALTAQEVADWHNDKDLMLVSAPESDAPDISDGSLTANDLSFTVYFQKATDSTTSQQDLVYKLYTSKTNALDGSVESIEAMGTLQDTKTDVDHLTASALQANTIYFYNVIVENLQGVKTAYNAGKLN